MKNQTTFKDIFSLRDKRILITGGAGYFGKLFVQGLLEHGADTVIIVEKPGTGHEFRDNLKTEYPNRTAWYETDLYDEVATDSVYDQILASHQVDILINNAFEFSPRTGFTKHESGVFETVTHDHIRFSLESGVWWATQAIRKFGLPMQKRGSGSIVNITSPMGVRSASPRQYEGFEHSPNPPGYGIAKAGLLALTRYSANFLAPVRVNALSPGAIPNLAEKVHRAGKSYEDGFLDHLAKRMALGRNGRPEELVGGLIFLASDASSYVTGHNLMVDGGWSTHL